jgi:N-acetylmuramoyl-L-alanine amidase
MDMMHARWGERILKIIYLKRPGWWMAAALAALLILCLLIALWWTPAAPAATDAESLVGKVALIDPGHGGFDPGAVADDGTHEDAINLAISLKLAQDLRDRGSTVIMTRMTERALADTKREDMTRRFELIKSSGADVVISIHMNHFVVSRYRGAQIFYRKGDEQSKELATLIQENIRDKVDPENTRQCKYAEEFGLLNVAKAPAVLAECGFLSNHEETQNLKDPDYQAQMAEAIAEAVELYFMGQ